MRILGILRDIVSADSAARAQGADAATDLIQEYSDAETLILTFVVGCSYEVETDLAAQEAQLHSLAEFAERGVLPKFVLRRVLGVGKAGLVGSSREHFDYLAEVADTE
ncbi:hypothetical protein [Actinophytocola gossypii]|uniref:Uncharacterized protein n=1 Tax=Actinophytocola gossypii TaxID=2812003 RepID=A0ABT2JJ62_9PSEU|nr:hypothetical protein [Actinophytocola gossypii]MCT2587922.1 hypothetical protein [Actinophytocola gossypii]